MTEDALKQGLAVLLALWPHRATDPQTVALLRSIYRDALDELSDEAWLLACRAAVRTCVHFPMPVELRELAEAEAERSMDERHRANEQRLLVAAASGATLQLTAGTVTPEQAAERAAWYSTMVERTKQSMTDADERRKAALAQEYWSEPRRRQRRGMRRPMPVGPVPS